jgi:hypothetical protein
MDIYTSEHGEMKQPEHLSSNGNRVVFEEPTSMVQAKKWRTTLVEEISDISTQLSNRNKLKKCPACQGACCKACQMTGNVRVSNTEYHQWRQGAITALRARENTLRRLNAWMEERTEGPVPIRPATAEEKKETTEADTLIKKAYTLLLNLRDDLDGDLDEEEMGVINSLGDYLNPQRLRQTGS